MINYKSVFILNETSLSVEKNNVKDIMLRSKCPYSVGIVYECAENGEILKTFMVVEIDQQMY